MWGFFRIISVIDWRRVSWFDYFNWWWWWRSWSRDWVSVLSNNTGFVASLMFDVLAFFLISSVINRFIDVVTNFLRMSVALLVGYFSFNRVTCFFWDGMTLRLVVRSVLSDGHCFANPLWYVLTKCFVSSIINSFAFHNGFWKSNQSSRMVGVMSVRKARCKWPRSIWRMVPNRLIPGFSICRRLRCSKSRRQKKTE